MAWSVSIVTKKIMRVGDTEIVYMVCLFLKKRAVRAILHNKNKLLSRNYILLYSSLLNFNHLRASVYLMNVNYNINNPVFPTGTCSTC